MIDRCTEGPFLGIFGPAKVNVFRLNLALDELNRGGARRAPATDGRH
ncbi:MAG TPA: potassium-transporting ATPase subunit C [Puia sp.]|nr:potassium-transporting ATPase subunit C [Puia sp.]